MARSQEEFKLTVFLNDYLKRVLVRPAFCFHVPNGENRSAITGARLKRMGVVPGVTDFILIWPARNVGFIEVKKPGEKLTPKDNQEVFMNLLIDNGHRYAMCNSLETMNDILKAWCVPVRCEL